MPCMHACTVKTKLLQEHIGLFRYLFKKVLNEYLTLACEIDVYCSYLFEQQ